jgi:uncharacterized protein YndB with AHSA1/START domain
MAAKSNSTPGATDREIEHVGTYLEIDRSRRLVFTFSVSKYSAESTQVMIELKPMGTSCELTLTHEGVLPGFRERTIAGWTGILDNLAASLNKTTSVRAKA